MNLMKLGFQSRKMGIKPRSNLPKDKFDMEDIDEFFSESSWSSSRSVARENENNKVERFPPDHGEASMSETENFWKSEKVLKAPEGESFSKGLERESTGKFRRKVSQVESDTNVLPSYETCEFVNTETCIDDDVNNIVAPRPTSSSPRERKYPTTWSDNALRSSLYEESTTRGENNSSVSRDVKKISTLPVYVDSPRGESIEMFDTFSANDDNPLILLAEDEKEFPGGNKTQGHFVKNRKLETLIIESQSLPSPPPEGLRRSKRTKIAPLAYWRNERVVYTRAKEALNEPDSTLINDIRKVPLQEIVEVVHVPERSKKKVRSKIPKKSKIKEQEFQDKDKLEIKSFDYESDPEIDGTEWFKQKKLESEVFETDETKIVRTIAWSPDGGEFEIPSAQNETEVTTENFRVASLFDTDLNVLAAGLLDFPIEGFKSLRDTGCSLFFFHVTKGLVEVTLNSKKFVVTRGCSFEIPKCNIYSFKNLGHGSARLFFVQCQMNENYFT